MSKPRSAKKRIRPNAKGGRLSRVPREALLAALKTHPVAAGARGKYGADLRELVEQTLNPTEAEALRRAWRYGARVSVALLLCTGELHVRGDRLQSEIQAGLDAAAPPDEADIERRMRVAVRDVERFDGGRLVEMRFTYGHAFSYIDLDEQDVPAYETRYGFAWISPADRFVAMSGDDAIIATLQGPLESTLGVGLLRLSLGKNTIDQVFPPDTAAAWSQIDPATNLRWRVSGGRLADYKQDFDEVMSHERERDRVGGLYTQTIDARDVNVGVTAPSGRLTTTRAVPADELRAWAIPKLRELAQRLAQLRADRPAEFYSRLDLPLAGVPARYRAKIQELVAAVADARSRKKDIVPLASADLDAGVLSEALPRDAGYLVSRPFCGSCDDQVLVTCELCGSSMASGSRESCAICQGTQYVCENGHRISLAERMSGLTYQPLPKLLSWISQGLDELQEPGLDRARESIRIVGRDLRYAERKLLAAGDYAVLLADVQHSTVMREEEPDHYRDLQSRVREGLDGAARTRRGNMASWGGDGGFWLFPSPHEALDAAGELHVLLAAAGFASDAVRIAIGWGAVEYRDGQYDGSVLHLVARMQKKATTGLRIALDSKTAMAVSQSVKLDGGHMIALLDPAYRNKTDQFFIVEARVRPVEPGGVSR
jgi:hypothetical protein